jgi:hypothetical protein
MASLLCPQDVGKLLGTIHPFCSQIIIKKMKKHLKCRLFILREVFRWRFTVDAGILRDSAIVRTEGHGSASKTCRIGASISSKGSRPELGRSLRSERRNLISCSQFFLCFRRRHLRGRLPLASNDRRQFYPLAVEVAHHIPLLDFHLEF